VTTLRRLAYLVFGVACAHLVFGAIVRISGSGMGCGDHWPKCYGRWFPPLDRPDLVIEVSHRYLASILMLSLIALLVAAWRRRSEAGVGGQGGVLRAAALAVALGFTAAILGAITVKLGNAPLATVAHWTVAMSLVAAVVATLIRAGGLGGSASRLGGASRRTRRAAFAGAALALLAVVMGGLTAKYPGAAVACQSFPLCGRNPDVAGAAVHVQLTHRVIAVLVVLHLLGMVIALRKRREAPIVRRAATIALSLGVFQLLVAGAMIGMHLPPMLRSLHEATGVSIWIATFALAYLARIASQDATAARESSQPLATSPDGASLSAADAASVRASAASRHAYASALAEAPRAESQHEPWQRASATGPHEPVQDPPVPGRPEIDEPPRAPGPDIPPPPRPPVREPDPTPIPEIAPPTDVPPPPSGVPPLKMTMRHSVAVIVARGAEH
jgi:cytochrome c oxidase assembly protein subunit 15